MTTLPEGFSFRIAEAADAALLHDLTIRCWTGTVAPNSSAYREGPEKVAEQLVRGGAVIIYEGAEPVASARYHPVSGPSGDPREWVEVKRVGVLKDYRSQGLGPPLVAAIEAEAKARGYAGAQLGVRHDQPRLIAFWAGLGYVLADDVQMHTVNPLTPKPTTMRKRF